jgi:hypothetical protein
MIHVKQQDTASQVATCSQRLDPLNLTVGDFGRHRNRLHHSTQNIALAVTPMVQQTIGFDASLTYCVPVWCTRVRLLVCRRSAGAKKTEPWVLMAG